MSIRPLYSLFLFGFFVVESLNQLDRNNSFMVTGGLVTRLTRVLPIQRAPKSTVSSPWKIKDEPTLELRQVTPADKYEVLSLDKNAFDGLDFLPDYLDFLMTEPTAGCFAIMDGNEMVGFVATNGIDGGKTLHIQALRMKKSKQGVGYFRSFARKMLTTMLQTRYDKLTNVYGPEHDKGNDAVFNQKSIVNMMHFITPFIGQTESCANNKMLHKNQIGEVGPISPESIIDSFFHCDLTKNYLFPSGRFVVELIPLAPIPGNIRFIKGRNSVHFSSVQKHGDEIRGTLSSAHILNHQNGTSSYNITITGGDTEHLLKHLRLHYLRAMDLLERPFCFQVFVENVCIKDNLPFLFYKVGMAKNGFVKVGTLVHYEILLEPWRKLV